MLDHQHRGQWDGLCPDVHIQNIEKPIKLYLGSPAYVGCQTLGKRPPSALMKSGGACILQGHLSPPVQAQSMGRIYMQAVEFPAAAHISAHNACISPASFPSLTLPEHEA